LSDHQPRENIPEKYRLLSTAEKWKWHASLYAFRRIVLNVSRDDTTSPCDPDGKWFNEQMITEAEYELRRKGRTRSRAYREGTQHASDAAGGRAIKEEWCRTHGYRSFADYAASLSLDYDDDMRYAQACTNIATSIAVAAAIKNRDEFREKHAEINDRFDAAKTLGVKVREYTPAELRAARVQLGIEQPEAADTSEAEA
jgi:hypothetical protein